VKSSFEVDRAAKLPQPAVDEHPGSRAEDDQRKVNIHMALSL